MAKKKKKKQRLKIKNILICLIILLVISFIIYYILMLPINNIYVTGNQILKESEILNLAKLDTYPSFLLTSRKKIRNALKENEYIKDIKVTKALGNKIHIKVEEFYPICILENENILLSSGKELNNNYLITDIPYLINYIENDEIKASFITRFSTVDTNILRQISQIEYTPVKVDAERFLLYMDDGNEVYITLTKIKKLNKYNEIVEKMDGSHGIIYLDSGDYIELKDTTEVINTEDSATSNNVNTSNENTIE